MKTASIGKVYPSNGITEQQIAILTVNGLFQRMKRNNHIFLTWKRY